MLCGGGGQHYLVLQRYYIFFLKVSLQFSKLIKKYFTRERLHKIYFLCQINGR